MGRLFASALLALAAVWWAAPPVVAQTGDVREMTLSINRKISEARSLYTKQSFDASVASLTEADKMLAELAAMNSADAKRAADNLSKQIDGLRKLLENKGVKLPERAAAPAAGTPNTPAATPAAGGGGTSFTKDVVPILVGKCNRCHLGTANRGNFSMNTYTALMQGANGVKMVEPGNGKGSRLYEVLESGDMPRGGGKLSAAELATIAGWITSGAKFDGPNANAPITTGTPAPAPNRPNIEVAKATGNEKVSFSRDIAPILVANCTGCHGEANNPSGGLRLTPFTAILRGGDRGAALTPGQGAASLIVQKLKGTGDGARMPARRPPLSSDEIAKFETWINEGAKFDGPDAGMPVATVAAIYVAQHMSFDDLAAARATKALKNWEIGNPEDKPTRVETPHFSIIGNTIESRLEEIGQVAEKQHQAIAKFFGVPETEPLLKGKLTLFVFARRFEYSEFGQMVERRRLPNDLRTHWYYDIIDAYACVPPPGDDDSLDSVLTEVIAGAYVDSLGNVPAWFSQGSGRAAALALNPKDPIGKTWDSSIPEILRGNQPDAILQEGGFSRTEARVVAYGFVKFLMGKKPSYLGVLNALKKGTSIDEALQSAYGYDPKRLVTGWAATAARGR